MVATLEEEIAALFDGQRLENPFPIWDRLREEAPVFSGSDMVILSRYADVKAMLPDQEHYSGKQYVGGSRPEAMIARFSEETKRMWYEMATSEESRGVSGKDEADHARLRGIAHRYFTPGRVRKMQGEIQRFWDELLEQAAQQETYDHKLLSQTLALRVITDIVGCPEVDGTYIMGLVQRKAHFLGTTDEELVRDAYSATKEFNEYIKRVIIAGYRRNPDSNDFVQAVMDAEGEENLSAAELCGMVATLLFGGIETTAVLLSTGLLELMQHRDQWEWLCEDPVTRVPDAVEELFRYVAPAQFVPRTSSVDFAIDGVEVPAETTVIGAVAAAHRDPAEYEKPTVLDITRGRPHLGLGVGHKFCIGAGVARAEAKTAFTTLAQRYPNLELAVGAADLDWSGAPVVVRSVRELPITLGRPA